MNCDQAFDDLTNPLLLDRTELEQHLRDCARCRQMQETLAPALSWMTDSPADWPGPLSKADDSGPLLTVQALQVAERCAVELQSRRRPDRKTLIQRGLALTAVALCGMAFGAWGVDRKAVPSPVAVPVDGKQLTDCLWTQPGRETTLAEPSARNIVASCILCHVPPAREAARFERPVLNLNTSFVTFAGADLDRVDLVAIAVDSPAADGHFWCQPGGLCLGVEKV